MNYTEEYWAHGTVLRFNSYDDLEKYFRDNFSFFKSQKKKTKVIGTALFIFS